MAVLHLFISLGADISGKDDGHDAARHGDRSGNGFGMVKHGVNADPNIEGHINPVPKSTKGLHVPRQILSEIHFDRFAGRTDGKLNQPHLYNSLLSNSISQWLPGQLF